MFRAIILVIALVTGVGAAWLGLTMRPDAMITTVMQQAPVAATQDVLVAVADLGQGERLSEQNVRWQTWPESTLNAAYISRSAQPDAVERLTGSVLRNRLVSGEPVLQDKLIPPNSGFLSVILPAGKRAVAVRVSAENTAGGFVLPNDRVDVIHTVERQNDGRSEQVSRTILKNVPVLAIDQAVEDSAKDEKGKDEKGKAKAAIGKTATLELDPTQAEVIVAAEAQGRLSLSLRSIADNGDAAEVLRSPPPNLQPVVVLRGTPGTINSNSKTN